MLLQKLLFWVILLCPVLSYAQDPVIKAQDVVITEIMADPSPAAGLPELEWIELRNRSDSDINLLGWKLAKPSSISGPMPDYLLKADSLVLICSRTSLPDLLPFGSVLSVTSFPSLSNSGDRITLLSALGQTVHSVGYQDDWYRNELKKQGGWTLEMIDIQNPCGGKENWTASEDHSGGTPCLPNSVSAPNPDVSTPRLLRAYPADSLQLVLVFDEPLDSVRSSMSSSYQVDNGIGNPLSVTLSAPSFDHVNLQLPVPIRRGLNYTVTVQGATDCTGQPTGIYNTARVALPDHADSLDIIINEILFNPKSDGNDFVEIYNRGDKVINLKNMYLANRDVYGSISNIRQLSDEDRLFFPGEFMVITENKNLVLNQYFAKNSGAFIELSSMPSFGDDEGHVVLLNEDGRVIDQVHYQDDWHLPLITDPEGVSLERIDYLEPSQQPDNWMSASSSSGYGTPTYINSQHRPASVLPGDMVVEPRVFSPDQDGFEDFALIRYRFPAPGFLANITVFDAGGRAVRALQRNAISGIEGYYRWDGLDDKGRRLPVGLYIVFAEIFNLEGKKKRFKLAVVLSMRH